MRISTETAILKVLSDILLAIDSGNLSALVLLDLSAAFDTVDHNIHLHRIEHTYQLGSVALEWFRSYLFGCRQHVRTSSSSSGPAFIMCGVPQGSILGPILFLVYTADLLSMIERHGFIPHLYADDTQILGSCRPSASQDLLTLMSACINKVMVWMRSNQLQLNTAKIEFLWSTTRRRLHQLPQLPLQVGSNHISPPSAVPDLGIYIDSDVSMRSRVAKMVTACYSVLHHMRTIRRSVCSSVVGVVSRLFAAGLRQFDTRRRFIISPVTAAVGDERRCSAHLFLVEVPAHHSAPSSAALAEGSRADRIQTISTHVQVSTRVRTCISYWRALSGGRCRGSSATPFQLIFTIDCQPHPTPYCR